MHELAVMEAVVATIAERIPAGRVHVVRIEVGVLSGVVPDALAFCFDVCARGTVLEGATLQIERTRGRGRCRSCGVELALEDLLAECGCGSLDIEVLSGQELRVKDVEVSGTAEVA
jgi:hydrogenase nickel incorporation protein HypA/HybF